MGLPGNQRLRRSEDFRRVMSRGRRASDSLLTVAAVRSGGETTRFGLSVGRRLGGAVDRNRVKRRLREALRGLEATDGWDVVVTAKPAASNAPYWQLQGSLTQLSAKLGMIESQGRPAAGPDGRD